MSLYNKQFKNCYEELISYYPLFYRDIYEMNEILKAFGKTADDVETGIERIFSNQFMDTAGDEVVKYYENLFGIRSNGKKTIEERRRVVKAYMTGSGKISASVICEMIKAYTGAEVSCRLVPYDPEKNNRLVMEVLMKILTDTNGNIIQTASIGEIPGAADIDLLMYKLDEYGNLILDTAKVRAQRDALRIEEIRARLVQIDLESVRPLRAVNAGTASDFDAQKLAALEEEAVSLREELAALNGSEVTK